MINNEPTPNPAYPPPPTPPTDQPHFAADLEQPQDVILIQDTASPEDKKKSFLLLHVLAEVFLFLVLMIMMGHSINAIYEQSVPTMSLMFGSMVIYNISHVVVNLLFPLYVDHQRLLKEHYVISALSAGTKAIAYLGFYLYTKNQVGSAFIGYYIYPDLFLRLALYCQRNIETSTMQTVPLLHSFSLLMIAGYFEDRSIYGLSMAFLVYYFFGVMLASLVILMWMLFGYLFKVYMITPDLLNTFFPDLLNQFLSKLTIYFVFCCWFTYHTFTYFMFIWGSHQLMARGFLQADPTNPESLPSSLMVGGRGLIFLGYFDLVVFCTTLIMTRDQIKMLLEKFKGKEITFESFKSNLQLNLQKRGENYFKRTSGSFEPLIEMTEHVNPPVSQNRLSNNVNQFGECQICMTNTCNTWFEPCGHTVICQQCLNEFLRKYDSCVLCRAKIHKVHLIYWDPSSKAFKSKGAYTLQN